MQGLPDILSVTSHIICLFHVDLNNIIQLLTNEALDMMWYRPENTNIDRGLISQ